MVNVIITEGQMKLIKEEVKLQKKIKPSEQNIGGLTPNIDPLQEFLFNVLGG